MVADRGLMSAMPTSLCLFSCVIEQSLERVLTQESHRDMMMIAVNKDNEAPGSPYRNAHEIVVAHVAARARVLSLRGPACRP